MRRTLPYAPLAASVLLSGALVPAGVAAQLEEPELVDVRFDGNEAFPNDSLARAILTRETECRSFAFVVIPLCPLGVGFSLDRGYLRERELPRDVARLEIWYQRRGFRDVEVDVTRSLRADGRAAVVFTIAEGRPFASTR